MGGNEVSLAAGDWLFIYLLRLFLSLCFCWYHSEERTIKRPVSVLVLISSPRAAAGSLGQFCMLSRAFLWGDKPYLKCSFM